MQAIILAAGMGKRLKGLTKDNPKCMVKVNGVPLMKRMLHQLDQLGLERIIIVIGYEGDKLAEYISTLDLNTPIIYERNPLYDKTNNIYSLALAKQHLLASDSLLLESDLILDDNILTELCHDSRPNLALVDKYQDWMDGTCVQLDSSDEITAFIPGKEFRPADAETYYKTVNVYKFSRHFSNQYYVPFLEAYLKAIGRNEYYEQVLRVITFLDHSAISAYRLKGERWYEVDNQQDLAAASQLFI